MASKSISLGLLILLCAESALAARPAGPLKDVKVQELLPGVYHLDFPTRRLLAATFLRFQEHYESPRYHGQIFTTAEFLAWYATTPKGKKSSYFEWDGFNVPSAALRRFYAGDFAPLDANERALLAIFAGLKGDFYVIGSAGKDSGPEVLRHEIAHGLYATNARYRLRADALMKEADLRPVFRMLERLGYDRRVWRDEAHAWLTDPPDVVAAEGLDPAPYRELRRRLLELYGRCAPPASR